MRIGPLHLGWDFGRYRRRFQRWYLTRKWQRCLLGSNEKVALAQIWGLLGLLLKYDVDYVEPGPGVFATSMPGTDWRVEARVHHHRNRQIVQAAWPEDVRLRVGVDFDRDYDDFEIGAPTPWLSVTLLDAPGITLFARQDLDLVRQQVLNVGIRPSQPVTPVVD